MRGSQENLSKVWSLLRAGEEVQLVAVPLRIEPPVLQTFRAQLGGMQTTGAHQSHLPLQLNGCRLEKSGAAIRLVSHMRWFECEVEFPSPAM